MKLMKHIEATIFQVKKCLSRIAEVVVYQYILKGRNIATMSGHHEEPFFFQLQKYRQK